MDVDILGTKYKLIENAELDKDTDGVCAFYSKEIHIRPVEQMLGGEGTTAEKYERRKEVIRHEIAHAYLYESGLTTLAQDETPVEWLATNFPKMLQTFQLVGGL